MSTGTLVSLALITLAVTLIHTSGFIENIDGMINRKWKFYHLPYPIRCNLCSVFWVTLFYVIITGQLSILTFTLCLIFAHTTKVLVPILKLIENFFLLLIGIAVDWIDSK